jgi:cyclic dehypoxanthinyl futalosine synthase
MGIESRLDDPVGQGPTPGPDRLSDREALELLEHGDVLELGAAADDVRRRLHPLGEVTFIVDRNINYTDYCVSGCRFCAFYKTPGSGEGYLLATADIHGKIEETLALGGTAIMMQGGLSPDLDISWFEEVFAGIKARFPQVHLHCLSPPEIVHVARQSDLTVGETLRRLQTAGLDSLPGGGAEVLVDRVRQAISPHKIATDEWLDVMRVAHGLGMPATATMMFGSIDTAAERVEHLRRIRDLQDETGGFTAFIPWSFQAGHTALEGETVQATGVDYLMTLAVSRLYLDNVPHIQASWVTQGLKLGQVALRFGADDLGSTMIEENVVAATGLRVQVNRADLVHAIRAAGFVPAQRRTDYTLVQVFEEAGETPPGEDPLPLGAGPLPRQEGR